MMYRKTFESMYEGSMVGAGSHVFAVMNYAITKQVLDKNVGMVVRLNPELLAAIIGDTKERMQEAIDFLCAPDPKTTTPGSDGRRLIQLSTFDYKVVNGVKYQSLRNEEERRAQNREAQARFRERHRKKNRPLKQKGSGMFIGEAAALNGREVRDLDGELKDVKMAKAGFDPLVS